MIRSSHGMPGAKPPKKSAKPAPRASGGARPAKRALPTPARHEREEGDDRVSPSVREPVAAKESRLKKSKAVPGATSTASDEAREIAVAVAVAAIDKKASGLEVIDVAGRVDYADFLVLMSGRSDRHVTALASGIEEALRKKNKRALAVEGLPHANWVLMDFGDVVVHVFQDDARAAYDIDSLWMDARRVPVPLPEQT